MKPEAPKTTIEGILLMMVAGMVRSSDYCRWWFFVDGMFASGRAESDGGNNDLAFAKKVGRTFIFEAVARVAVSILEFV